MGAQRSGGRAAEGSRLPVPEGWRGARLPLSLKASVVGMTLIVVCLAAEAVWLAWVGRPVEGVPLVGAAAFLGHALGLAVRLWRRPRRAPRAPEPVPADGSMGVRFGYSGWTYYWFTVLLVVTEVVVLLVAAGAALEGSVAGWVSAAVATAGAGVVGWLLLAMLRTAPGGLVLSPAGIDHRGLASAYFIPWDAVVAVSARWPGTPAVAVLAVPSPQARLSGRTPRRMRVEEVQFLPIMVIRTAWLAADPVTVYHALSFYHANPRLRGELATHDAVHRIADGLALEQREA